MFEDFVTEKLSQSADKLVSDKVLPLGQQIDDLVQGVEIITDVIAEFPKQLQLEVSKLDDKISKLKPKNEQRRITPVVDYDKIISEVVKEIPIPQNGIDGVDGVDGSPDTGKDIAKKLNTLKGVINKDVIIGLDFASQSDIDRAVSILDQRTQYLINKTNNSSSGVASLNTLTGDVTLAAGTGITLTPVGNTITIDATGGGGGVELGGAQTGFSDGMIQYIDEDGLQFGDLKFTRNSINENLNLETTIDGDRSIKFVTDFDGSILSVPAIANLYTDTSLGITTGFFIAGDLGSESSQMVFDDGTNLVNFAIDSVNAGMSYTNGAFTTNVAATDIGVSMGYNDTINSVTGGLSFGSNYVRLSRTTTNVVPRGAVEIGPSYLEIYRDVSGVRKHGSILMEDDLITIGDPTGQSTDTNIIVDIAGEIITLTTGQTAIDSGQIIKRRAIADANITIGLDDYLVTGTSVSVDRVASLPAIGVGAGEAVEGVTFVIKNKSDSTANITLTPDGADTIDGQATITILPGQSKTIVSDGSGDWEII